MSPRDIDRPRKGKIVLEKGRNNQSNCLGKHVQKTQRNKREKI